VSERRIFHLAIPVAELEAAKRFYTEGLGARVGRQREDWIDVLLWGHQITLHLRPSEVLAASAQGKRHFGVVLPWSEWEETRKRLTNAGVPFLEPPAITLAGTPQEQAKMYLADPSHNVIEIKAYRDLAKALGYEPD
jgi:extradiol dioxygenase family protein